MNQKEVRTQITKKDQDTKGHFQILSDAEAADLNGGSLITDCVSIWTCAMQ